MLPRGGGGGECGGDVMRCVFGSGDTGRRKCGIVVEFEEEGEWQSQRRTQKKAIRVVKSKSLKKLDAMSAVIKGDGEVQ